MNLHDQIMALQSAKSFERTEDPNDAYAAGIRAAAGLVKAHQAQQTPAAQVASMPGTSGFTIACFKADEVPEGTLIYTAPQSDIYREALKEIAAIEDEMVGGDWEEIDKARDIATAALEQAEARKKFRVSGVK